MRGRRSINRENWYAREKRWAASSLGEESLEESLDSVVMVMVMV